MTLEYSSEPKPLGTAGAVRLALPLVLSRDLLVLNGDSYCRADLRAFRAAYEAGGRKPTLLLVEVSDASRFGLVELESGGNIRRFAEKTAEPVPGVINAGIYMLPSELVQSIPPGRAVSLEREMFPVWVSSGLRGYRCGGPFIDIGTPETYAQASQFFGSEAHEGQ
jgi:NDP-sugar pyrophosphorylase family protein